MKNITKPLLLFALTALLWSCNNHKTHTNHTSGTDKPALISGAGVNASSPYFTKNQNGDVVLCWTEALPKQESFVLKFAVYNSKKKAFDDPVTVTPSNGTYPHPESMNKVAFKSDGTIVAVYAEKNPTEENPFAGFIFYSQSFDQGETWTPAHYLHTDTLPTYGRSFFDLATLADGEVGAIWLDGRFGEADVGSALFFAKTEGDSGFGTDKQIGESTCECCRTDLYVDQSGSLHVAYRDIIHDNIRDMVYQKSENDGKTFSEAQRISRDNWKIDGCPHTGPSLTSNEAGVHAVWFTAGGGVGVYRSFLGSREQSFSVRKKISMDARHPQLVSLQEGKLAIAWDEPKQSDGKHIENHTNHNAMEHSGGTGSKILLQIINKNTVLQTKVLTGSNVSADHSVLVALRDSEVLVTWTQRNDDQSGVYYRQIDLDD